MPLCGSPSSGGNPPAQRVNVLDISRPSANTRQSSSMRVTRPTICKFNIRQATADHDDL
jgi:hypothetical protein